MQYDSAVQLDSPFSLPALRPSLASLRRHFESARARERRPLRNHHQEEPVSERTRAHATPSAVLIPVVDHGDEPTLLFTRRHHEISYPGHVCFPGGRADEGDAHAEATALREAHEEIGLEPRDVTILGHLGEYYTQSGYRIDPVVGWIEPALSLTPAPGEVSEILEIPLAFVTRSSSYALWRPDAESRDAFYSLTYRDVTVAGPTVCLLMGLYEELAATHTALRPRR